MSHSNSILKSRRLDKLYRQKFIDGQAWEVSFVTEMLWDGHKACFIMISDCRSQSILAIEEIKMHAAVEVQLLSMLQALQKTKALPQQIIYESVAFMSAELNQWFKQHAVRQIYAHTGKTHSHAFFSRLARKRNSRILLNSRFNFLIEF